MKPLQLQARPYVPGRIKGPLRIGPRAATADGIVILDQRELAGFAGPCSALAVIDGQPFSHTMIRLLGSAIPTIIITQAQAVMLPGDREMVLDGHTGMLCEPQLLAQHPAIEVTPADPLAPLLTRDGERIILRASAADRNDVMRAPSSGATAIGLLHMEYLGSTRPTLPDAGFFASELSHCCRAAAPLTVTFRLPDISIDKLPRWCQSLPLTFDNNRTRGTRIYDREPFKTLLDNILEGVRHCAQNYQLRLMLPFIDSVTTFVHWRDQIKQRLPATIAIGAILETVSAIEQIDQFFAEAAFIAIGTNDLSANLLQCARDSDRMTPYDPAIYRLLQQMATLAGNRCKEIQLDGQLARMPGVLPVLIGLGYRTFCLAPVLLPYLAEEIREIDISKAEELARQVLQAGNIDEVKRLLQH